MQGVYVVTAKGVVDDTVHYYVLTNKKYFDAFILFSDCLENRKDFDKVSSTVRKLKETDGLFEHITEDMLLKMEANKFDRCLAIDFFEEFDDYEEADNIKELLFVINGNPILKEGEILFY